MNRNIFATLIIFICVFSVWSKGYCEWIGPVEVVSGAWGSGEGEFGYKEGETEVAFPQNFYVNTRGDIYIVDGINDVIHKYNQMGQLLKTIKKPDSATYWNLRTPYNYNEACVYFSPNGGFIVEGYNSVWMFFGPDDNFIVEKEIEISSAPIIYNGYFFKDENKITYSHYSLNGEFLGTYDQTQLKNMGIIKDGKETEFTIQIKHNSGILEPLMKDREPFTLQIRYNTFEVNAIFSSFCLDKEVQFKAPKHEVVPLRPPPEKDLDGYWNWKPEVCTIYGNRQPVISIDDDIYCVKYHRYVQEKYSIIKWVWTDGPDTPFDLMAKTSGENIILTWRKPEKDAETVTGYEINRSTEVCGAYKPIVEVKGDVYQFIDKDMEKGIAYYYQIRAIRDKSYSGYSDKAKGVVK